jgi:hypothetical protein
MLHMVDSSRLYLDFKFHDHLIRTLIVQSKA